MTEGKCAGVCHVHTRSAARSCHAATLPCRSIVVPNTEKGTFMTDAIDHVGWQVDDYDRSIKFYSAALKPLGWKKQMEFKWDGGKTAGFGPAGKPFLWLSTGGKTSPHIHFAFAAPDRGAVDAFYKAAMKAGGKDNGKPGLRPEYHEHYYAAFVFDPDGHNIEAVIHTPPPKAARKSAAARKAPAKKKPAARKKK
jgi:catechol 2,3-dioxygenase-like lactoylglutathione lyase family enzyme